jgi:predicted amidophosphoribosyltransferase
MFKFSVLSCLVCGECMAYCINCGEKLTKEALYCARCGVKAAENVKAGNAAPSDEMREALTRMSHEMEKAFTIAAKEIQDAFQTAKINVQKTLYKEPVVCMSCGEKNSGVALYCFKCGQKLQGDPVEQSK